MTTFPITATVTDSAGVSATATTSATTSAGTPIIIGETTVLSTVDNGNGNLLVAMQAALAQVATIQSLSFYIGTVSGGLRLGIYDATGAGANPGNLLAATAAFTPVAGWNTANVVTPVLLQPGAYWLAYLPQNNALAFRALRGSGVREVNKAFTYAALPATFPASPAGDVSHWSFYATLIAGPQAPVVVSTNFENDNGWGLNTLIGVVAATNNPTSFQISGNPNNYFTIDNAGNLRTSATIAVPAATYNISIAATNSVGQGAFMPLMVVQGPVVIPPPPSGDPFSAVDGFAGALYGTAAAPQYPTVLNSFVQSGKPNGRYYGTNASSFAPGNSAVAIQPPWFVAGVDYYVGINPALNTTAGVASLLNPNTLPNSGSGFLWTGSFINLTGSGNYTLNGYNLSDVDMDVTGFTGTATINNCYCGGANGVTPNSTSNTKSFFLHTDTTTGGHIIVTNCTLDCGGTNATTNFQTFQSIGPSLTIQYCWIRRSAAACGVDGGIGDIRFNLFEMFCYNAGAGGHANCIYINAGAGGNFSYNFCSSNNIVEGTSGGQPFPVGLGASIAAFTDFGSIVNCVQNNNTQLSLLNGATSYFQQFDSYNNLSGFTVTGICKNNYLYATGGFNGGGGTGAFGPIYTDSGAILTASNNWDMFAQSQID